MRNEDKLKPLAIIFMMSGVWDSIAGGLSLRDIFLPVTDCQYIQKIESKETVLVGD
jgi:hypothetical protein